MKRPFKPGDFHDAELDSIDFSGWPDTLDLFFRSWPATGELKQIHLESILSFRYETNRWENVETYDLYVNITQDEESEAWRQRLRADHGDDRHSDIYHVVVVPMSSDPEDRS